MANNQVLVVVHDVDDNLNDLAAPLAEAGLRMVTWDVQNDFESAPSVEDLDNYVGFISLGAHNGILDEPKLAWMQHERKLISRVLDLEMPFLGLCFGSQILAATAGAKFKPSPVAELGWTKVQMTDAAKSDPVLGMLDQNQDAFHFHYDSYELPENATLLGETNGIIEAFRVGSAAWALQFHLEVGLNQQLAWLTSYRKYFEKEGLSIDGQIDESHEKWKAYRDRAYKVGSAFAEQIKLYAAKAK